MLRKRLEGAVILVLEDEPFIRWDLVTTLHDAGALVLSASSLRNAADIALYADVRVAMLDIKIGGDDCRDVCQHLDDRGIPFAFYTGATTDPVQLCWPYAPVVSKPATGEMLVGVLAGLMDAVENRERQRDRVEERIRRGVLVHDGRRS